MKVIILKTNNTPADRDIAYLQDRLERSRLVVQQMDADSREGVALCELYDLTARPAVAVVTDDGHLIQSWQGQLPSAEEVTSHYQVM